MDQPLNLPELEQIISALVADAKCACHIINPNKTRLLMWVEVKDNQTTYHLKIGLQKFTSQPQKDRNGATYWRFWTAEPKKEEVNNPTATEATHAQSTNPEPTTNEQPNQNG